MWYALVQDEQLGPMSVEELFNLQAQEVINRDTMVWREGLSSWMPDRKSVV